MTRNDAVAFVVDYCKKHSNVSTVQAVEVLRPKLSALTSKARWELVAIGLGYLVGGHLTGNCRRQRRSDPDDVADIAKVGEPPVSLLASTYYQGFGGLRKPLIEFTIGDLIYFKKARLAEAIGLKRRIDAADRAAELLKKFKVKTIGDLPMESRKEVEQLFEVALARAA